MTYSYVKTYTYILIRKVDCIGTQNSLVKTQVLRLVEAKSKTEKHVI